MRVKCRFLESHCSTFIRGDFTQLGSSRISKAELQRSSTMAQFYTTCKIANGPCVKSCHSKEWRMLWPALTCDLWPHVKSSHIVCQYGALLGRDFNGDLWPHVKSRLEYWTFIPRILYTTCYLSVDIQFPLVTHIVPRRYSNYNDYVKFVWTKCWWCGQGNWWGL